MTQLPDALPDADGGSIAITGSSGFLGGLIAATALAHTQARLVLPLRDPAARESVLERIAREMTAAGRPLRATDRERLVFLELPTPDRLGELYPSLRAQGVVDVLHCAGCLSYFNVRKLQEGNIELTQGLVDLANRLGVRRFVFLSSAYSAGFTDRDIPERLHVVHGSDPTEYTRTKRDAEMIVAESGLRWVIARPSIVIGDSRDGRYGGKPYGVYQLWTAGVRFLNGVFPPALHAVAGEAPINLLHQDAFAAGFWAAYRNLPDGAIVHLVSREEGLPSTRDLWTLWMGTYGGPRELHFYDKLESVPMDAIDEPQRLFLEFTAVNNAIASVRWRFRSEGLEALRKEGLAFPDATLESVERCQRRFIGDSPPVQRFIRDYRAAGVATPRIVVHGSED